MMIGGHAFAAVQFQAPPFGWLGSLIVALSIGVAVLAYTTGFRWRQDTPPARFGLLALRLGAIVCLFLTLLHPAWVSRRMVEEKPTVAVVLDNSASMGQPLGGTTAGGHEGTQGVGEGNRYGRAVSVLREGLLPALDGSHRLRIYDVEGGTLNTDLIPGEAAGKRSPLTDTLLRVQRNLRGEPLVGIALLSDGAETTDQPALGSLEQLRVPVYAINIAEPAPEEPVRADVSIQSVAANRRALIGNTVRVVVDIAASGALGAIDLPVSILDGSTTIAARTIQWRPDERLARAELEFVPRRIGQFTYTAVVGGGPGESDLGNNRTTFPLSVRAKPLTVLYVDGVLRWEGKFVRDALAADPDINVISSVRTARVGADHGSQGLLLAEQLANVDVVILGDVEARYFSTDEELQALRSWVVDAGGGLLLTGGYHSFGPQGFGLTVLRDILPVELSGALNPQIERPLNLKLTEAGREHPIFQLSGDRVRDTGFFHKLPTLDGCSRVAGVKSGAEVLAVAGQGTGAGLAPAPAAGSPAGLPIMVVQQVGAGRTMVFAVDTTWRWRTIVGGFTGDSSFYEQFWGQLVRWLASEAEQQAERLLVSTDRSRYRLGETIELHIEIRAPAPGHAATGTDHPAAGTPNASKWHVKAEALDERGKPMNVPLVELGDGRYRGQLAAAHPGRLDVSVTAEPPQATSDANAADDQGTQSRVVTVEVERLDLELLSPRYDRQWLARVTQLSGGRLVPPDEIESWASALPAAPVQRTLVQTSGAWGDWLFGGAFVLLICAEWVLRRRSQLA
jgi:uncharacterized membrane protein